MKRLPFIVTVLAVVLLSVSLAYWGLQLFRPQQRAIAAVAPPPTVLNLDAARGLFGGQTAVAVVSNYRLKGVVAALDGGTGSAAILAVDNQPTLTLGVGREVVPGVTVKEVHPKYVLLSEGGAIKRVDLPSDASGGNAGGNLNPLPAPSMQPGQPAPPIQPQQSMPQPQPQQPQPQQQPQQPPPQQNQQNNQQNNQQHNQQNNQQNNQQRSSVSPTTIAPVPGFDRQP